MPNHTHTAESGLLAEALGRHLFLRTMWPDVKSRCTCGHEYDNPNASEGYSHPQHVAEALTADGWTRPIPPGQCTCGEFEGTSVSYADCPVHGCPIPPVMGTEGDQ